MARSPSNLKSLQLITKNNSYSKSWSGIRRVCMLKANRDLPLLTENAKFWHPVFVNKNVVKKGHLIFNCIICWEMPVWFQKRNKITLNVNLPEPWITEDHVWPVAKLLNFLYHQNWGINKKWQKLFRHQV